jgi:hypothetical protein
MAKRVVYLYKDKNICIIPTVKVEQLKRAAEALFREYKHHKATRVEFDRKLKTLYRLLGPWTRIPWERL